MQFDAHFHPCDQPRTGFCNASSPNDWQQTLDYCAIHESAIPFLGIHPWYAVVEPEALDRLRDLVQQHNCGIGEIGLDGVRGPDIALQQDVLKFQLILADEFQLPITFHCVRAWGDLMGAIRTLDLERTPCMIHGYRGSPQLAEQLIDLGVYIAFGPQLLDPQNEKMRQAFLATPLDRLFLETDAPHAAAGIAELYEAAGLRSLQTAELEIAIERNCRQFTANLATP